MLGLTSFFFFSLGIVPSRIIAARTGLSPVVADVLAADGNASFDMLPEQVALGIILDSSFFKQCGDNISNAFPNLRYVGDMKLQKMGDFHY